MSISYVGVDLGSSKFHQVAINQSGAHPLNREFVTSAANLVKAFSDLGGEIHVHLEAGELAPSDGAIIQGNVGIGTASPTSKLQVVGLPVFANNAAAITGIVTANRVTLFSSIRARTATPAI
jgi:hypothetical protein